MFRDFVYLDTERIQSIIAQLQHGLLNQVMEGTKEESSKRATGTLNLLSMLIPFSASASVERRNTGDIQKNKVLHDYAFNVALTSLEEKGFLLVADQLDPSTTHTPEAAFILVKGSAKIFDYSTFQNLAEHEKDLNKIFPSKQQTGNRDQRRQQGSKSNASQGKRQSAFGELKVLVDAFFQDMIQVRITN